MNIVSSSIQAQEISFYNLKNTASILYSIEYEGYRSHKGYLFNDSNTPTDAFNLLDNRHNTMVDSIVSGNKISWIKKFDSDLPICIDSVNVQMSFYSENIQSSSLYLIYNHNYQQFEIPISGNGYQKPVVLKLKSLKPNLIDTCFKNSSSKKYLKGIAFSINQGAGKCKFIVSELRLLKISETKKLVSNVFLDKVSKKKISVPSEKNSLSFDDDLTVIGDYFDYGNVGSQKYYIECSGETCNPKEIALIFFEEVFNSYPYYEYVKICKNDALQRLGALKDSLIKYTVFLDSLNSIISQFEDPHFKIVNSPIPKKKFQQKEINPLPYYNFNDRVYIAAVFDTTVKDIFYGDQVLFCHTINDSEEKNILPMNLRSILIEEIDCNKSYLIKTINSLGDTITTKYRGDSKNIYVPNNFKPENNSFKLCDNISYFAITHFERSTYEIFLNHFSEISNSKGLIFDLRNCPGGNTTTVNQLISLFIKNPLITQNTSIVGLQNYKETYVLKPNRLKHLEKPICILVNNNTACGAEYFITQMKKANNSIVVGNSKTAGTYSTVHDIIFPDGLCCRINCFTKEELYPNVKLENIGLEPDIWVQLPEVKDLYPYEDKILRTAIKFIKAF